MTKSTKHDQETVQNADMATEQTHSPGRRRLIQGASVAPVLLVSGRSALACNPDTDKCGLSPMAWISAHPNKGQAAINVSHAVGCNSLGKNPNYWTSVINTSSYKNQTLPFYSTKTIKVILYGTDQKLKYYCAAYLNAATNPTYALTTGEVATLYGTTGSNGTLGGRATDWTEAKMFLEQTWS
ncbi:MAG: hypothetical protein H6R13_1427 [Proteobacteria bacterium]|nr:hypothetical protein [Pseudomonadota bacterium]